MTTSLPNGAHRLFAHYENTDLSSRSSRGLICARLLEEGNREDLAWLTRTISESELTRWLRRHGNRQLSRRSRAFWRLLLQPDESDSFLPENDLWPL